MSTKDYQLLIEALKPWRPTEPQEQRLYIEIIESIAETLKQDNKRFNKELFLKQLDV